MQFSRLLVASAAFALAHAQVILTNMDFAQITAGVPFKITWAKADGPVALILRGAQPGADVTDSRNLFSIYTIESNLQGVSEYTWNVPANTPQSTYAIEIQDSKTNNYGSLWEVIDGVPATTLATGSFTGTRTATRSATGTDTASVTSTGTESVETASATGSVTRSGTVSATRTSTSASSTATAPPAGGMAPGLTSNLALVFGAAAALFMLN